MRLQLAILLLAVLLPLIVVGVVGVWLMKRKLDSLGKQLPGALQQWEKEIEKLEKPKG